MKAVWKDTVVAESRETVEVEGITYFPPDAIDEAYFIPSDHHTTSPLKGEASYFHIVVDGETNRNAAWYYPNPTPAAEHLTNFIAFRDDVSIEE